MWLFIWDSQPSKIFVGDTPISKVFLWDTQVRPSGWQPWSNTIYYLPLDADLLDHSWNGYTFTPTGTVNLVNNKANIPVCYINRGSLEVPSNTYTFWSDDFTVSYWVNIPTDQDTYYRWVLWFNTSNYGSMVLNYEFNQWYIWSWPFTWDVAVSYPTIKDTWVHFVTVRNWSTFTTYSNWVLYNTATSTSFSVWQWSWTVLWIGRWQNVVIKNLYISNFIIENKARTAEEVADYYNQTKWDYWIS